MNTEVSTNFQGLLSIDRVQEILNRSRASVYRYANTESLNLPYNSRKLNPEHRQSKDDPLLFHPNEVSRFARDILGIKAVAINVQQLPPPATEVLLAAVLVELKNIHQLLQAREQ